ncbi:MAG: hypothetical protein OXF74_02140 [Rhodobacteraceae bacterium]|nr:hypothetical protein [Paracoccaceae bacterium]
MTSIAADAVSNKVHGFDMADATLDQLLNFAHRFELKSRSMRRKLKPLPLDGGRTGESPA